MSALDKILDGADDPACVLYHSDDPYFDIADRQRARSELSSLLAKADKLLLYEELGWEPSDIQALFVHLNIMGPGDRMEQIRLTYERVLAGVKARREALSKDGGDG